MRMLSTVMVVLLQSAIAALSGPEGIDSQAISHEEAQTLIPNLSVMVAARDLMGHNNRQTVELLRAILKTSDNGILKKEVHLILQSFGVTIGGAVLPHPPEVQEAERAFRKDYVSLHTALIRYLVLKRTSEQSDGGATSRPAQGVGPEVSHP
jgi:hypothetical protein